MMSAEELKRRIAEANSAYRLGEPVMGDSEYDSLLETLRSEIPADEYAAFAETLNEGAVEGQKTKVRHPFVMGSLNKLKYECPSEVLKFVRKRVSGKLSVSAKVDGISCRLHYEKGKLVSASTRGDGVLGVDITDRIRFVKFVPETFGLETADVRGELVILKSDFEGMEGFANPRNACAGIVNRKDFTPDEMQCISFIAYTILGDRYTKSEQFDILSKVGKLSDGWFKVAWHTELDVSDDSDLVETLFSLATQDFEYETDGLVLCSTDYRNETKYYPDACAAFKLNQLVAQTRIVDVEWSRPSKDGRILPVAILEPVQLGGSVITRATLHNDDFIRDRGIAYGSLVDIVKGGDIIPKVLRVVSNESTSPVEFPSVCPCCGTELSEHDHFLFCPNPECSDQTTYQVQHFLEKLGIENVSFKRLRQFGITTIGKLIRFTPEGKGKIGENLCRDLKEKMFTRPKRELLEAMNFNGISTKILGKIFDFYGFEDAVRHENLKGLPLGVGEKFMERFLSSVDGNMDIVRKITSDPRYSYEERTEENRLSSAAIIGSICFTGSLRTMGRKEATILAERNGYEVKSSVTKGLTYLVTNDPESGSSKNEKAKKLGTVVIGEEEFLKLMDSNGMNVDDL